MSALQIGDDSNVAVLKPGPEQGEPFKDVKWEDGNFDFQLIPQKYVLLYFSLCSFSVNYNCDPFLLFWQRFERNVKGGVLSVYLERKLHVEENGKW